uniref:Cytochrome oxidase subunit II copper A binding domain-containing protein n=1 Tax=Phlegmariurus squarrosus TaxID=73615 RepID=H9M869_PHLSQ|nr:hypothetical protein HusqMp89 [Phlegmariurus squarrosus]AEV55776.1 hypothetical protein HusqMp89 [Phlegmariurus squarrosus]
MILSVLFIEQHLLGIHQHLENGIQQHRGSSFIKREGVYYGQCSKFCGTNHAFMRAPEYIGRLLSPLWLSHHTFSFFGPVASCLRSSYHSNIMAGARGKRGSGGGLP